MEMLYMTEKGQVTVPVDSRDRNKLSGGSVLMFLETKSGVMVLKPVREKPEMTLLQHLRRFKGVEFPQIKAHCAPRV